MQEVCLAMADRLGCTVSCMFSKYSERPPQLRRDIAITYLTSYMAMVRVNNRRSGRSKERAIQGYWMPSTPSQRKQETTELTNASRQNKYNKQVRMSETKYNRANITTLRWRPPFHRRRSPQRRERRHTLVEPSGQWQGAGRANAGRWRVKVSQVRVGRWRPERLCF